MQGNWFSVQYPASAQLNSSGKTWQNANEHKWFWNIL